MGGYRNPQSVAQNHFSLQDEHASRAYTSKKNIAKYKKNKKKGFLEKLTSPTCASATFKKGG